MGDVALARETDNAFDEEFPVVPVTLVVLTLIKAESRESSSRGTRREWWRAPFPFTVRESVALTVRALERELRRAWGRRR